MKRARQKCLQANPLTSRATPQNGKLNEKYSRKKDLKEKFTANRGNRKATLITL